MARRVSRRDFVKTGALAAGAAAVGTAGPTARAQTSDRPVADRPKSARNVILLVSDGMSVGTLTLADMLLRHRGLPGSAWVRLWDEPGVRRSTMNCEPAIGYVTDSAAAASAWAVGTKCANGAISVTPDARSPTPLLVHAAQHGKATGVVTTTRVTHATPAAFYANAPRRSMERAIAEQLVGRKLDVALGGGAKHFPDALLRSRPELDVVRDTRTLRERTESGAPGPLLGLFNDDHMSYVLDRQAHEPGLVDMTRAALRQLEAHDHGFVLQIEAGRVDHAAHANDAGALVTDQIEFDETIGFVRERYHDRDDTLVIITTDHANANPGLTFYGDDGLKRFSRLNGVRRSFEWIADRSRTRGIGTDATALHGLIEEATGVALTDEELDMVRRAGTGRIDPFGPSNGLTSVLGSVLANHFGVAFLSPNHTSDLVELTAWGPGSEALPPYIQNHELHALMVGSLGLGPADPVTAGH